MTRQKLIDRLRDYFLARPNEMVNAKVLSSVAGFGGWRTRISDLRYPPYNMDIKNVPGSFKGSDGQSYRTSHYVYRPASAPAVNQVSPDPWSLTAEERA